MVDKNQTLALLVKIFWMLVIILSLMSAVKCSFRRTSVSLQTLAVPALVSNLCCFFYQTSCTSCPTGGGLGTPGPPSRSSSEWPCWGSQCSLLGWQSWAWAPTHAALVHCQAQRMRSTWVAKCRSQMWQNLVDHVGKLWRVWRADLSFLTFQQLFGRKTAHPRCCWLSITKCEVNANSEILLLKA